MTQPYLVQINPLGGAHVSIGSEGGLGRCDPRVLPRRASLNHDGLVCERVHVQPGQRSESLGFTPLRIGRAQDLEELPHLI